MSFVQNLIIYFGALDSNGILTLNSLEDYYDLVTENNDLLLDNPDIARRYRLQEVLEFNGEYNEMALRSIFNELINFKDTPLFDKPINIEFVDIGKYELDYNNITPDEIVNFIKDETNGESVELINAIWDELSRTLKIYLYFNTDPNERFFQIVY